MEDLAQTLTAVVVEAAADFVHTIQAHSKNDGVGTKKTGYASPDMGPFECEHCVHVRDKGTKCIHPDVLADIEVPKTPDQKLAIVDPKACCNYFHPIDEIKAGGPGSGRHKEGKWIIRTGLFGDKRWGGI